MSWQNKERTPPNEVPRLPLCGYGRLADLAVKGMWQKTLPAFSTTQDWSHAATSTSLTTMAYFLHSII